MKFAKAWLGRKTSSGSGGYDSVIAYQNLLKTKLALHRGNRDLAFAEAIGSVSLELFRDQGDATVTVLRHHGLADGMRVYDLGCGCGRTAQALQRSGWQGQYAGADIIDAFIAELRRKCPGYDGYVHRMPSIRAEDETLDIVYHWSVFTHVSAEECFLYMKDSFRALKPGGKTVFSFMELAEPSHVNVFDWRANEFAQGRSPEILDTFLHRDWIKAWAEKIGFTDPTFTDGDDSSNHPPFWQTLAIMTKPA